MKRSGRIIAGFAAAFLTFAAPVSAQDHGSKQYGNTTVTVGGGTAILTLPDVEFTKQYLGFNAPRSLGRRLKDSKDFGDEIGWNVNGSFAVPMGENKTVSLDGFLAQIDDNDALTCVHSGLFTCDSIGIVDDPNGDDAHSIGNGATSASSREVDHWGASLVSRWFTTPGIMGVTQAPPRRYWALAADVRGINQDLSIIITRTFGPGTISYNEDLDTTYYGAYVTWGGDYAPFLLKGLWSRLGLQSSFQLRGGVYHAKTDYSGRNISAVSDHSLSLSRDDAAFIGGLVLETSKRIGARASLSLRSEYEYYSYVPEMRYNDVDTINGGADLQNTGPNNGTSIGRDNAYSARTSLRLTIKLGPDRLFQEPLK